MTPVAELLDFGIDPRLIYGAMWLVAMTGMAVIVLFGFGD